MIGMTTLSTSAASFDMLSPASSQAQTSRELGQVWLQAALGFCVSTAIMVVILAAVVG